MSDWVIIHDARVDRQEPVDTKLLYLDGKRIVRHPEPAGFVKPNNYYKYGVE